jgi:triacylglycerol lipase
LKFLDASRLPSVAEIIVTGHSLGGALATVFAPWLHYQLSSTAKTTNIKVYTFAAPTAGNQAFANMYNSKFSQSFRYHNDIDVIPKAWADLSGIKELFPAPGPACPWEMKDTVDVVGLWLSRIDKVVYVQPDKGIRLNGRADATGDFLKELGDQHGHNTYLALLGAPLLPF